MHKISIALTSVVQYHPSASNHIPHSFCQSPFKVFLNLSKQLFMLFSAFEMEQPRRIAFRNSLLAAWDFGEEFIEANSMDLAYWAPEVAYSFLERLNSPSLMWDLTTFSKVSGFLFWLRLASREQYSQMSLVSCSEMCEPLSLQLMIISSAKSALYLSSNFFASSSALCRYFIVSSMFPKEWWHLAMLTSPMNWFLSFEISICFSWNVIAESNFWSFVSAIPRLFIASSILFWSLKYTAIRRNLLQWSMAASMLPKFSYRTAREQSQRASFFSCLALFMASRITISYLIFLLNWAGIVTSFRGCGSTQV